MRRVNISDPPFSYDATDIEGFRAGLFRPGFGAQRCGVSVYEVPPGQSICPYHYEYGEEEWLLVLDGRPLLRTPEGTERLERSDLVFFPIGPDGAHKVTNDTESVVRVVMWSNVMKPHATAYPDSGKVGVQTGFEGEDLVVRRSSGVDYFDGEER